MKFLLAVDDTPVSHKTFDYLLSIIKPDDEVLVLGVAEDPTIYFAGPFEPINLASLSEIHISLQNTMKSVLKCYGKELVSKNIKHTCLLGKGPAKETICEEAKYRKADLIVIGRNELSGVRKAFYEAHSTYVLHNAPCGVLVVKSEFETTEDSTKPEREETTIISSE